jgi:hypothetical protein
LARGLQGAHHCLACTQQFIDSGNKLTDLISDVYINSETHEVQFIMGYRIREQFASKDVFSQSKEQFKGWTTEEGTFSPGVGRLDRKSDHTSI